MSRDYVCFHEAGHIATAIMIGASVKSVELFPGSPPCAKTSVERNDLQAVFIACGGFAAEYCLYNAGRLVDRYSRPVNFDQFFAEAKQNAAEDVVAFDGALTRLGINPSNPMEELIGTSGKVLPFLNIRRLEKIAEALSTHGALDSEETRRHAGAPPWRFWSDYTMARMNGYGRLPALRAAFRRPFG